MNWAPIDLEDAPRGECNRCRRKTWSASQVGTEDRMTQPDGNPCGGKFVPLADEALYGREGERDA